MNKLGKAVLQLSMCTHHRAAINDIHCSVMYHGCKLQTMQLMHYIGALLFWASGSRNTSLITTTHNIKCTRTVVHIIILIKTNDIDIYV